MTAWAVFAWMEVAAMTVDMEEKIATRAYYIWLEEGQLLGRDKEHWAQARRDLGLGDDIDVPPLQPEPTKSHGDFADRDEGQATVEEKLDARKLDTGAVG